MAKMRVTFSCDETVIGKIDELAVKDNRTRSAYIEGMLKNSLEDSLNPVTKKPRRNAVRKTAKK